ncbi:MAG: hypothetical protein LAN83_07860 [Acidobacteriia bacterium]|nr:hypothetical protein [Terriglobia bacterium]
MSVLLGVVTLTAPVVAPVGTVVLISEPMTTVKVAAVPLNVTLVAPVRLVEHLRPHFAERGRRFHEGAQTHTQAEDRAAAPGTEVAGAARDEPSRHHGVSSIGQSKVFVIPNFRSRHFFFEIYRTQGWE